MLAAYIQYKYIYIIKCTFPNPKPSTDIYPLNVSSIYIQYKNIYYKMYIP